MTRLIDTMDAHALETWVYDTLVINMSLDDDLDIRQELENLFKPVPHWSDNLDVSDPSTWVLCWVSDRSASSTSQAKWIYKVNSDGSYGALYHKYATPIDLNLRYKEGEE